MFNLLFNSVDLHFDALEQSGMLSCGFTELGDGVRKIVIGFGKFVDSALAGCRHPYATDNRKGDSADGF